MLQLNCSRSRGYEPWLQAASVSAVRTLVAQGIAVLAGRPNAVLFPPHSPGRAGIPNGGNRSACLGPARCAVRGQLRGRSWLGSRAASLRLHLGAHGAREGPVPMAQVSSLLALPCPSLGPVCCAAPRGGAVPRTVTTAAAGAPYGATLVTSMAKRPLASRALSGPPARCCARGCLPLLPGDLRMARKRHYQTALKVLHAACTGISMAVEVGNACWGTPVCLIWCVHCPRKDQREEAESLRGTPSHVQSLSYAPGRRPLWTKALFDADVDSAPPSSSGGEGGSRTAHIPRLAT